MRAQCAKKQSRTHLDALPHISLVFGIDRYEPVDYVFIAILEDSERVKPECPIYTGRGRFWSAQAKESSIWTQNKWTGPSTSGPVRRGR